MKRIKLFYRAGTLLILSILLNACWKSYSYEYIDQETKDYCIFQKDSYWIYQDSITHNIDSVIIRQSLLECVEKSGEWGHVFIIEVYESEYCHYLLDTSVFVPYVLDPYGRLFPTMIFNSGIQDLGKNIILYTPYIYPTNSFLLSYNIGENVFNNIKVLLNKLIINGFVSDYFIKCYWATHRSYSI